MTEKRKSERDGSYCFPFEKSSKICFRDKSFMKFKVDETIERLNLKENLGNFMKKL